MVSTVEKNQKQRSNDKKELYCQSTQGNLSCLQKLEGLLHLKTNLAKLLEVQVLFFFYYLKRVYLRGEQAIQWKDNWVK